MTTGVYARISLDPASMETGVTNQITVGCELCERNEWADPRTFVDNDLSATYGGPRPAYDQLLAEIEHGSIDRVVVLHLSRLWRNRAERAAGIEIMRRHAVSIICVKGPSLEMSTAYGRAMAGLLGEFDTMEVEVKSERHLLANAERAKAGRPAAGGHRAMGYDVDKTTVVAEEADAVRSACNAVMAGVSLSQIARDWNSTGLRTARAGNPWTMQSVRKVLTNPRIAGIRAHLGVEIGPGTWPAIVEEPTYRAVVAYLSHPGRRTGGSGVAEQRLLTGIAVCGVPGCGLAIKSLGPAADPEYRCPTMRHLHRRAAPVNEWVTENVVAYLSREDAAELLVDRDRPDVAELTGQAVALRARIAVTRREFAADDTLSPAELREILAEQRGRLAKVEAAMADAGRVDLLGPLVGAEDVRTAWEAYGRPRQRLVIDMLMVVRIWPPGRGARRFDPSTVEIVAKD